MIGVVMENSVFLSIFLNFILPHIFKFYITLLLNSNDSLYKYILQYMCSLWCEHWNIKDELCFKLRTPIQPFVLWQHTISWMSPRISRIFMITMVITWTLPLSPKLRGTIMQRYVSWTIERNQKAIVYIYKIPVKIKCCSHELLERKSLCR